MAKKFNLREFQTALSQQLQAAASRDNTGSRLGFRVGDVNWLVSLSDTEEVVPLPPIVKVPGTRRWFRGVANIRGNLYAVSDFADFMGQGVTPDHADCRLLIPHHDFGVNAALLVHATLGLKNISRYRLRGGTAAYPWIARHYADEAGANWCDMDFGQLLGNADFLKAEAQFGN
ncbi:MAG: chemotaxis protein CheW [Thiobacillus sp.]|jgi:twitching motility protein PilI|uniref:chemotaxis protein CheW n=1 Tax=Thiobacillus sp. TaxID=924 RepID=UPI0028947D60|nr:chemotaxis protein CheW [Thiobacillus sp.]MDT3705834.1 chemotaxis protein CheW [Thiobacillus sp.]